MEYAIIKTGGKQYKVSEGDIILIEKVPNKEKESIKFTEVLLYSSENGVEVGQPILTSIVVEGEVLAHVKGEKIDVRKFKAKVHYRRKLGHRQKLSQVKIKKITDTSKKEATKKETASKKDTTAKKKSSTSVKKSKVKA